MLRKKIGGNQRTKEDKYIKKILAENDKFYRYEIDLIYKAFKLTLQYFMENCIEFEIKNVFKFIKFHKKDYNLYVRYRDEYTVVPAHDDMKFKVSKKLKDYLNHRHEFENVRRREILPDGLRRTNNLF